MRLQLADALLWCADQLMNLARKLAPEEPATEFEPEVFSEGEFCPLGVDCPVGAGLFPRAAKHWHTS